MARDAKRRWFVRYTGMFLVSMLFYWGLMYAHGRLPMYDVDGYMQHFTVLGVVSRAVRGLLAGEGYRMVNFSLGQGMDVLTTLSYYGYTDPLNLLAALFPQERMVLAYLLIDALRAYLGGVCLIAYARRIGARDGWALSCAGMIYVFSGYGIYNLAWHVYFLNGALYLPLMLLGVENLLRERRWLGFSVTTALMLAANFYFAYMNTLVVIVYIVVRLIARAARRRLGGTARDGFALMGAYILGTALAAVAFVPVVCAFLRNARLGAEGGYAGNMLRYSRGYYEDLLVNLFNVNGLVGHWTILNYAPLALFGALALLFRRGAKARQLRIGIALSLVALGVPMVGRVMNGGSYVNNRWCYVLGLFLAAGCALALPDLFAAGKTARRRMAVAGALLYCAASVAAMVLGRSFRWISLVNLAMILAFALFLLLYDARPLARLGRVGAKRTASAFLAVCVMLNMYCLYRAIGFYSEMMPWDLADVYANETVAGQLDTGGAYRIDQQRYRDHSAALRDYLGTGFYWSMVDWELGNYYSDLGLATQPFLDCVYDLGGGASMTTVAATKYWVLGPEQADLIAPYGFEAVEPASSPDGTRFKVFENRWALPLGYAFDAAISVERYDSLPVEAKMRALTACAVCDTDALPQAADGDGAEAVFCRAEALEGVELEDGALKASAGGRLRLAFETLPDSETWLIADGLKTDRDATFRVQTARGAADGCRVSAGNNFYYDRPVTAVCLGGGDDVLDGCEITFKEAATYRFDGFRIVCLPLAAYRADVEARRAEAMEDVRLGVNALSGRISVAGTRVVQIAVPYSSGWTARVDGAPAPVLRCGVTYMGLALPEGTHTIEMTYVTPGLRPGAAVTAVSALLAAILAIVTARRRRAADAAEEEG